MAGEPLSDQPSATVPGSDADFYYIVQSGVTRKQTRVQLRTGIETGYSATVQGLLAASSAAAALAAISGAPLASPALTGTPTAPTATIGTNTTQLATTAFVKAAGDLKAPLASPTFTGAPSAPTPALGVATTQLATMKAIQDMMVGTVADTAGLPTGAAVEYTTGANGACLRFADGTQICTKSISIGSTGFSASGSVFISSTPQGAGGYVKNFVGVPQGFTSVRGASGLVWYTTVSVPTASAWQTFYLMSSTNSTTAVVADMMTIGRWK